MVFEDNWLLIVYILCSVLSIMNRIRLRRHWFIELVVWIKFYIYIHTYTHIYIHICVDINIYTVYSCFSCMPYSSV